MKRIVSAVGFMLLLGACGGGTTSSVPSGLSGEKMGTTGFHLTWKDNSTDEQEFVVEQKVDSGAFAELAKVPFNTTQYMVESGQAGKEYKFRVRARLPSGLSDPSNEVMWMP